MAATDSTQHRAAGRAKSAGARAGYLFLHSAVDGFSRLAYSEHLFDETAATAVGFWARARVWFAAHGITTIPRVATDNGSAYRSATFARAVFHSGRHQRTRSFSLQHNGKVERYQRILAEDLLYIDSTALQTSRAHRVSTKVMYSALVPVWLPVTAPSGRPPRPRRAGGRLTPRAVRRWEWGAAPR